MLFCSKLQGLFFVWNIEQKITIDDWRITIDDFLNGKWNLLKTWFSPDKKQNNLSNSAI